MTYQARHRLVLLSAFLLPVVVVGCTGIFQNIGARWVTRKIAAEFDLDDQQKEEARGAVDRLIAAAPAVLGVPLDDLVTSVDRAIVVGLNEDNVRALEVKIDELVDVVAARVIDEVAPLLPLLRDEQIEFAENRANERFAEKRKELDEPADEREQERLDEFVEAVEKWSGSLSDAQEDYLRDYVSKIPDETEQRIASDEQRLTQIADTLRAHPGAEAIRDALWEAWENREDWGPEARPAEVRRAQNRQTLIYIDQLMDPLQEQNARDYLQKLYRRVERFLGETDA